MKPIFVDNRDGNSLHKAITSYLRSLRDLNNTAEELWIASAYFNPQGLELLAEETRHVKSIRLLLGAEPTPEALRPKRTPYDPKEPEFSRRHIKSALAQLTTSLREDRDLLPFDLQADKAVRRLLEFLRSGKIEVKRYEDHFLHAKAYVFRGAEHGLLSGSSNLTRAGMMTNLELNLGHYDDPLVERVEQWYQDLWEKSTPLDLAEIYEEMLAEYPPYLIYLKVLWHLYGDELAQEEEESGHLPVTTFQKHGVWRARKILDKYGGVVIADGVGLGKTFSAGEIIRLYRERRQRVLLIRPAALDKTWEKFLNRHQLLVETISYEKLAQDAQLGGERPNLLNPLDDYALVVVDEAHNYRNPDTPSRAAVLRKLLFGRRRDLVLLTATPVNNSLWDIYHLIRYFLKQDAALADRSILSIRERFHAAMRIDPYNLHPDMLYPIIDATTVKRTRRFVKKHYANDMIPGPDGTLLPIRFPKPEAITVHYNLDTVLPGFFNRFAEALMPESGPPALTLARYMPENYPAGIDPELGDTALVGLIRSGLLKRFESSAYAFLKTIERMIAEHRTFMQALKKGKVVRKEFLKELSAADDETDVDLLIETSDRTEDGSQFNLDALQQAVLSDLKLFEGFASDVAAVASEWSPKFDAFIEKLAAIAKKAKDEAFDDEDERLKRKVLIFSSFEDTIDWLESMLATAIKKDARLAPYRGRMASVSGAESRHGIAREKAIYGFAPISSQAPPGFDKDRYDLLLSTDVLAEGVNLQQCRHVINFDMPWNPMRLVQRHGRIDRIGSPHERVYLHTFFPDEELDDLLKLEERVRRKLAQAAASVGLEDTPIEHGARGMQSFAETRDEIERLHKEDPSLFETGGTQNAAQTGEEYRQELRKGLERWGNTIQSIPWKSGSGMVKGKQTGYLFCAQAGKRIYLRFVPFDMNAAEVVSDIGFCLRLMECTEDTPRNLPFEMMQAAYEAWNKALDSIYTEWMYQTDPANLQPKIPKLNRDVATFIRRNPPSDIDQVRLHKCLDAVESPWSRREESQLRAVFINGEDLDPANKSRRLIEEIERIGIEPFHAPEPLPPINTEDIHLICWILLRAENEAVFNSDL